MTVQEVITELKTYPAEMQVVTLIDDGGLPSCQYDNITTPAKRTAALLDTLGLLVELSSQGSEGVSDEVRERLRSVYQHFPSYSVVGLLGQYMSTWFGSVPSLEDRLIADILEKKRTRLLQESTRNQQTS